MLLDDERAELRCLVDELGEPAAVELLGVNRATLARALGGLPVRRATLIALRLVLEKRQPRDLGGGAPRNPRADRSAST